MENGDPSTTVLHQDSLDIIWINLMEEEDSLADYQPIDDELYQTSQLFATAGPRQAVPYPIIERFTAATGSVTRDVNAIPVAAAPILPVPMEVEVSSAAGGIAHAQLEQYSTDGDTGSNTDAAANLPYLQPEAPPPRPKWESLKSHILQRNISSGSIGAHDVDIVRALRRNVHHPIVDDTSAVQDQAEPMAVRRYATSIMVMPQRRTNHGCWKEKDKCGIIVDVGVDTPGFKRTFKFLAGIHGRKTKWLMHEYVELGFWGIDLFFKDLFFREVKESPVWRGSLDRAEAQGCKFRMRQPDDPMVMGRESQIWEHFLRIYDKNPEVDGYKIVYALCCYCGDDLKAASENGTKSLRNHWRDSMECNRLRPATSSRSNVD
ncbi:hypothetical protein U9M48_003771 [Paspalum notatum var. saurae]|uniref:BED-type domain-containing protein n=1 Tax=Paspalum notatum var. saurae TaxID=547442 RepID=A0AAQ3SH54_PASNO